MNEEELEAEPGSQSSDECLQLPYATNVEQFTIDPTTYNGQVQWLCKVIG